MKKITVLFLMLLLSAAVSAAPKSAYTVPTVNQIIKLAKQVKVGQEIVPGKLAWDRWSLAENEFYTGEGACVFESNNPEVGLVSLIITLKWEKHAGPVKNFSFLFRSKGKTALQKVKTALAKTRGVEIVSLDQDGWKYICISSYPITTQSLYESLLDNNWIH